MREQIIDYIKTNRISTTEAADCMGKSGLFTSAYSLSRGRFKVGRVKWLYAYNESNWSIHEHLSEVLGVWHTTLYVIRMRDFQYARNLATTGFFERSTC